MVFFFALAAKEVFEAMLPGGPLSSLRKGAMPILAAVGGMTAPALIYIGIVSAAGTPELSRGWAIPCATDIAFSFLAIIAVFKRTHPAVPFLLLLAIADDALGLLVLAIFYPSGDVSALKLFSGLIPAMLFAELMRRKRIRSYLPYVFGCGSMAWIGMHLGGLHPALALVPIVPLMPHAKRDLGMFADEEPRRPDTLSRFEHDFKLPVQLILFFFGFANAGVPFSSVATVTWAVTIALIIGKPLGILAAVRISEAFGFERARGLDYRAVAVLGVAAGIGFTVALFFTTAAFPPGQTLNAAKMGALLSFMAFPLTIAAARLLRANGPRTTSARSPRR
jgi:Na+:H+ antiporter, NhaA family